MKLTSRREIGLDIGKIYPLRYIEEINNQHIKVELNGEYMIIFVFTGFSKTVYNYNVVMDDNFSLRAVIDSAVKESIEEEARKMSQEYYESKIDILQQKLNNKTPIEKNYTLDVTVRLFKDIEETYTSAKYKILKNGRLKVWNNNQEAIYEKDKFISVRRFKKDKILSVLGC